MSPRRSIDSNAVHGLDACYICAMPQSAFIPYVRVSTEHSQNQKLALAMSLSITTVHMSFAFCALARAERSRQHLAPARIGTRA